MTGPQRPALSDLVEADVGTWGNEADEAEGSPVLRSTNIHNFELDLADCALRRVPKRDTVRKRLEDGDVLVTASSGSPGHIGKCCLFRQPPGGRPYYFSNFLLRLRPRPGRLEPRWLFYWLSSPRGRAAMASMNSTTSGLRNLNKSVYLAQRVPLPPLTEQRRIAAILDKADAIRKKRRLAIGLINELIRSAFIHMFGDPLSNPKGWPQKPLEDLCVIRRGASPRPISNYLGGSIPWIKIGDATGADDVFLRRTSEFVTEGGAAKSLLAKNGSLILANSGVSLGFARILAIDGCVHDGWLSLQDLDASIDKFFLLRMLNVLTSHLRAIAPEGTQPNLNTAIVKALPTIVPPLAEQRRFGEFASKCLEAKRSLETAMICAQTLSSAISMEAFAGGGFGRETS